MRVTLGVLEGEKNDDDGVEQGEQVVNFPSFLAGKERVFQSEEQIDGVADVEADREQFEVHVDEVVGFAELLFCG